jgi:hypothetical protein
MSYSGRNFLTAVPQLQNGVTCITIKSVSFDSAGSCRNKLTSGTDMTAAPIMFLFSEFFVSALIKTFPFFFISAVT